MDQGNNPDSGAEGVGTSPSEQPSFGESATIEERPTLPDGKELESKYVGEGKTFKSYQDLESAYAEANSKIQELGTSKNDVAKRAEVIDRLAQTYGYTVDQTVEILNRYAETEDSKLTPEEKQTGELRSLRQKVEHLEVSQEVKDFIRDNPIARDFAEELYSMKKNRPDQSLSSLWKKSFGRAFEVGRTTLEAEMRQKETMNLSSGKGSGRPVTDKEKELFKRAVTAAPGTTQHGEAWADMVDQRLFKKEE